MFECKGYYESYEQTHQHILTLFEGDSVGVVDGAFEGDLLGDLEGMSVTGESVTGSLLGLIDGEFVTGLDDGFLEGESVTGLEDGLLEGELVTGL